MYRVSTTLQQRSWDNILRMESLTNDPFEDFEGTFSDNKQMLPNGVVMNVPLAPSKHDHVIGLLRNLSGAGVTGRTDQLGEEIDQVTKEIIVFSNDVSQAVNTERYGIDAHDKEGYAILEKVQPQLSLWHKEIRGKYYREGLLERYSINLTVAPISRTKRFNENWLVKNVALTAQPTYDSTSATYQTNISDAGVTGGASADWDIPFLQAIVHFATAVKSIEPLDNGRYIVLVPSRQTLPLLDPTASDGLGIYKDSNVVEAATNSYRQYLGSWNVLDLFKDERSPVIDDASGTLTALYKGAGSDDDRETLSGTKYDIGYLLGKGAVINANHEMLHFEEEVQNYKKVVGVGAFAGFGATRLVYDDEGAETDTSQLNQNSIVLMARRQTITA